MSKFLYGLVVFSLILTNNVVFAQSQFSSETGILYLQNTGDEEGDQYKRGSFLGPHDLGDQLTKKKNDFEKAYVYYKSSGGAYPTEEKIVQKQRIYKAVNKLNKHYIKEFKRKNVSLPEAVSKLEKIYEIGLKLKNYNTDQVEKDLKKIRKPEEIEEYLMSLKFS